MRRCITTYDGLFKGRLARLITKIQCYTAGEIGQNTSSPPQKLTSFPETLNANVNWRVMIGTEGTTELRPQALLSTVASKLEAPWCRMPDCCDFRGLPQHR